MDGLDKIVVIIICTTVGLITVIAIICFISWLILCRKSNITNYNRPPPRLYRQKYRRSKKFFAIKFHNNKEKIRKNRFSTSDSSVSLSFNPPHLINQNVKRLDKLTSSTNLNRCYTNLANEPVYTSSSSVSASLSNLALVMQSNQQCHNQQFNTLYFRFLNELNHILSLQQEQQSPTPLRYSQSCRRINDTLPFDYSRSITPSTITVTSSSNENSLEPICIRMNNYFNSTLIRKAQLRDDTVILY